MIAFNGRNRENWSREKSGLVRENGKKIHEAIDTKSFNKGKDSRLTDSVYAFMDGKVVYANASESVSSYDRYVVLEHKYFLTLYAHLASISISTGKIVKAGGKIDILGTSSNCAKIPKARAQLHFEIDYQIGDNEKFRGVVRQKISAIKTLTAHTKGSALRIFWVMKGRQRRYKLWTAMFQHIFCPRYRVIEANQGLENSIFLVRIADGLDTGTGIEIAVLPKVPAGKSYPGRCFQRQSIPQGFKRNCHRLQNYQRSSTKKKK
jgi:murein DD-endopeptidase MepM/ murein hydrolase activator NlpD